MALVSISEASKLAGKSRRTIQRHIDTGKLSKVTDDTGNPKVDTSEILRVYGSLKNGNVTSNKNATLTHNVTSKIKVNDTITKQEMEIALLRQELKLTKELLDEKEKRNNDLTKSIILLENKIFTNVTKSNATPQKKVVAIFQKKLICNIIFYFLENSLKNFS